MIGDASLFNILLPVLITLALAARGLRVDEAYMASWANWFNLGLTHENRSIVSHYLKWTRRCRTAGGVAGFLAPTIYFEVVSRGHQQEDVGGWAVTLMFVGYLLGALVAEFAIAPPTRRREGAVAVQARLGDHLPTYAVVLQRGLAIVSVLVVGLYALSEPDVRISDLPTAAQMAALGVGAASIAAVVEAVQRRIVARRRPVTTKVGVAVDSAIMSSSLHVLAGGSIALLLGIAAPMFILSVVTVSTADSGPPAWAALGALGLVGLSSLYFWLYFGKPGGFGIRPGERQGVLLAGKPLEREERL